MDVAAVVPDSSAEVLQEVPLQAERVFVDASRDSRHIDEDEPVEPLKLQPLGELPVELEPDQRHGVVKGCLTREGSSSVPDGCADGTRRGDAGRQLNVAGADRTGDLDMWILQEIPTPGDVGKFGVVEGLERVT